MTIDKRQAQLRRELEVRGIYDRRVLDAVECTRRDLFVPEKYRPMAYDDIALPISAGQTISQPYIVALMTQELALQGDEHVLEIGTGSGYQAAILSQLARELVTIERVPNLSRAARQLLEQLGCDNVDFHVADGTLGCPERAPYDRVLVTAAAPDIPQPLFEQINPGGRMVIPVGDQSVQSLIVCRMTDGQLKTRRLCPCRFVKLIGQAGWAEG